MSTRSSALLRVAQASAVVALGWAAPHSARAAGVEDTVTGTVALGRAANYARVNDFMAVWQNPANLALVPGSELSLDLRMPFFRACFDREPDPAIQAGGGYLATESPTLAEECNDAAKVPGGALGFALPLARGFGFGVGMFTPGGVANLRFGHDRINTVGTSQAAEPLPITSGAVESATRFLMVDKQTSAAYLMAGVGYQPIPMLRLGLSVGGGFVSVGYQNVTSLVGGTFADPQVVTQLEVVDAFVPRATVSAALTPLDAIDLMASFTWNGDVKATGTLDVTANGFETAPRRSCAEPNPGPHCRVDDVTLEVPYQRFEAVVGARYAQRRTPRERALDPLRDEVWDIELDAYWVQTSHVDAFVLKIHDGEPGSAAERRVALSSDPAATANALPKRVNLFHGWQDTYGVRLGGDYNVLPSRLALRAGLAYESRGVPTRNMSIDYWPIQKVALSLGATVAFGKVKLSLAYAHVFYEEVNVPVGQGNVAETVARAPELAQAANEGRFTAGLDVVALQASYRF